jgi:signal transduction histidine kinase
MRFPGRLAVSCALLFAFAAEARADLEVPWRILILQGGEPLNPGSMVQEEALRKSLAASAPRPVAFHAEYLDSVRFDTVRYESELLALYRRKYEGVRIDLLACLGPVALRFAERHREVAWPGIPIVFFSVGEATLRESPPGPGVTGVMIGFDEPGTIALARRLQPAARRLLLVSGASDYDRSWEPRLREAALQKGEGLDVSYSFGEPMPVVLRRVAELPRDSIVLYTTIGRDGRGVPYVPRSVADDLGRASAAPVYAVAESQLGHGIVGGSMQSMAVAGESAAGLALRVLSGEKAETIPVEPAPKAVPMVDWRQLRRWELSEKNLPPGSTVLFKSPSLWDEYGAYIAAVALTLVVQAGLIVALLFQSRRRRQAELETQRQRTELAHAARLSAVGQLTASIAHEINQPLGAILSNAEAAEMFLNAEPPRLDRVRQILADIGHEDRRASEVIRHVRSLLGKAPTEMQTLALNEVAQDVLDLVASDALRRGITLKPELHASILCVRGDRVQIQQALLNLVLNAMEALEGETNGDRRIVVRTSPAPESTVDLVVADNGPGIPKEHVPNLFESFFTTKPEGMGLGLSIVRSIVEAHDGRIEAGQSGDGGALFRLRLPAVP